MSTTPLISSSSQAAAPAATANPPYLVVLDEMGYYLGRKDDGLREILRAVDGIPNTSYMVKDGRVFVFDKLVSLVRKALDSLGSDSAGQGSKAAELALKMLPEASVTPSEAVVSWNVVPEPYAVQHEHGAGYWIKHTPLNASVPGGKIDKHTLHLLLEKLLIGKPHGDPADFVYRGQPMRLLDSVDPSTLPERPVFNPCGSTAPAPRYSGLARYSGLGETVYAPGFTPVTEASFTRLRALELSWLQDQSNELTHVKTRMAELWAMAPEFGFEVMNDPADSFEDYEADNAQKLRELYPELGMLAKASLWAWFDCYQVDNHNLRSWDASRQEEFLPYLLGKKHNRNYKGDSAEKAGLWACSAILKGIPVDQALSFGQSAQHYTDELMSMAYRVSSAMQFLERDKGREQWIGSKVTTFTDVMRIGRKFSSGSSVVTQKATDFSSGSQA